MWQVQQFQGKAHVRSFRSMVSRTLDLIWWHCFDLAMSADALRGREVVARSGDTLRAVEQIRESAQRRSAAN
jgi:hypothetical protein